MCFFCRFDQYCVPSCCRSDLNCDSFTAFAHYKKGARTLMAGDNCAVWSTDSEEDAEEMQLVVVAVGLLNEGESRHLPAVAYIVRDGPDAKGVHEVHLVSMNKFWQIMSRVEVSPCL